MSANPQSAADPQSLADAIEKIDQHIAQHMPREVQARLKTAIDEHIASMAARSAKRIGDIAPDFSLPDAGGQRVSLTTQLQGGPVVVMFYRGSWCPYCDLTLRAYSRIVPDLQRSGATFVAVSPQRSDVDLPNAVEHRKLGFPLLSDVQNSVARRYGLVYAIDEKMRALLTDFQVNIPMVNGSSEWELPVPATYIVAKDGTIRWAHVDADYRIRPEPARVLRVLANI